MSPGFTPPLFVPKRDFFRAHGEVERGLLILGRRATPTQPSPASGREYCKIRALAALHLPLPLLAGGGWEGGF